MYTLRSRSIPLNTDYDVIVVGGGPSGCTAAAAFAANANGDVHAVDTDKLRETLRKTARIFTKTQRRSLT